MKNLIITVVSFVSLMVSGGQVMAQERTLEELQIFVISPEKNCQEKWRAVQSYWTVKKSECPSDYRRAECLRHSRVDIAMDMYRITLHKKQKCFPSRTGIIDELK